MVKSVNHSVGILGGSFDPAHKGHVAISRIAIKKIKLKKVFWIIAKKNPFKKKSLHSLNQRIEIAKKISKKISKVQVSYLDETIGSSRSIDIVNYLIKEKKLKNIYFLIGSDNLIGFHKWKNWKKIVELTKLVVFSRKGYDKKGMKSKVAKYLKNKIIFIKNKPIIISSTELRKKRKKNF
tara:strand:- start:3167 stop:3706 length:540 start_codon:yes stop_codon:yes gene_type:complete